MDRVWKSGAADTPPDPAENTDEGYATAGNPGTGTPATKPGAYMWHQLVEEIMAVIEAGGLTPDKEDTGQLLAALEAQGLFGGGGAFADETHSAPAITSNVLTLDLSASRFFKVAFGANITTTTINNIPASSKVVSFVVKLTANGSPFTWAWLTGTVKWDGGVAPTFVTTNNKRMVFRLWTDDGGTNWYGQTVHMNL